MSYDYFLLTRDEVIARRDENRQTQVWWPTQRKWADYPADIAHEGREISEAEAAELGADPNADFGEFAPQEGETTDE